MTLCAVLNDLGLSGLRMPVGCLIHHNLVSSLLTRRKMDTIPLHSDIITSLQHAIGFRSIMCFCLHYTIFRRKWLPIKYQTPPSGHLKRKSEAVIEVPLNHLGTTNNVHPFSHHDTTHFLCQVRVSGASHHYPTFTSTTFAS